ncbi:pantoate--beta-alanine ligase [Flaviaesturariibacter aridisoli]|uniref:Pantothenate synthetase n=1 Tax=Flaviaesturariibacter aridisoli TaxID=2545761 RepID=A0A4R4E808_9BACT|nr:pantoate--beta-alanine ligase [Flaviaesturariibacter aridisoli]TCZ73888.1 pantoate--beta-alanine ligase [Flaviaesturariibacter aridisoli]
MIIFKTARDLSNWLSDTASAHLSVGFVPTMGALHEGHLSLIARSRADNARTVCSIFVNPTQFNNSEDYSNYPISIDRDVEQLLSAGCDALFLPSVSEVYPPAHVKKHYDLGPVETVLEGAFRPGHFQGVCEVVERLLDIVRPQRLYLGQKDFQQCMVLRRLLQLTGKESETELVIAPTLRESDGLAMSSRNLRLDAAQRGQATAIFRVLEGIRSRFGTGDNRSLEAEATAALEVQGFRVDYIAICEPDTLLPKLDGQKPAVVLAAAFLGPVRLIDNMVME